MTYSSRLNLVSLFIFIYVNYFAQHNHSNDSIHRDTHYMIIKNQVKSKFWGNSWHLPIGYSVGISQDLEAGIGRSYKRNMCGGAGCFFEVNSWGVGYGIGLKSGNTAHSIRGYYGYNFLYFPPFSAGIRGDYVYDISNHVHYLKPSLGFSFILGELFYSYGLKINKGVRMFPGHAFTLRINLFYPMKKWEEHRPNRC
ncbi:MAG: hypothetical protein RLZ10_1259 [Bacteroidota bacterium]|jgi:hypothetical protein